MKKYLCLIAFIFGALTVYSQTYVALNKNSKIYDEPNLKYVTLNQNNEEISALPGMTFKQVEKTPGWIKIEYSPGLHAYIQDSSLASQLKTPAPGTYKVQNNPTQQISISENGDNWEATIGGKNYKGKNYNNIIVFLDDTNQPAFSLVDLGDGGVSMSYDNNVTKFF